MNSLASLLCVFGLVALGCASHPTPVVDPVTRAADVPAAALEQAKPLVFAAVAGDDKALADAMKILQSLYASGDDGPKVKAYLGTATLLSAPRAGAPWEMGKRTREGIEMMDRAVAEGPGDVEVRTLRGLSYFRLPRFIGRGRTGADDLELAARQSLQAVKEGQLDPALAAAALYHHGLVCERNRDASAARASFQKAVEIAPGSLAGKSASERLGAALR